MSMAGLFVACISVFGLIVLFVVLFAAAVSVGILLCATLWALVKPLLAGAIDAWMEWFERRTEC